MYQDDEDTIIIGINEIKTLRIEAERCIIAGKCSNYENYRELVGRIRAYQECESITNDILNKMRSS
jgi:hypothetical protein